MPQTALNKDGDLSFQAFKNGGVTVGQKKEGALNVTKVRLAYYYNGFDA